MNAISSKGLSHGRITRTKLGQGRSNHGPELIGENMAATSAALETTNAKSRMTDDMNMMTVIAPQEIETGLITDAVDYSAWINAEAAIAETQNAVEAFLGSHDEMAPLVHRWWLSQVALCKLEPQNMGQAIRQIEVALKDGELEGVDPWAIIARAKVLAGDPAPKTDGTWQAVIDGWRAVSADAKVKYNGPDDADADVAYHAQRAAYDALMNRPAASVSHVTEKIAALLDFMEEIPLEKEWLDPILADLKRIGGEVRHESATATGGMDTKTSEAPSHRTNAHPDAAILTAMELRTGAMKLISERGAYRTSEYHSARETGVLDAADDVIIQGVAVSPQGVLAKAWVTWAYVGKAFDPEDDPRGDLIRRMDFDALDNEELDFEDLAMLQLIRSLRGLADASSH